MPERAINTKSATGCLLILLPAAMAMSALFVAWPLILVVTLLIAGGTIFENQQWSKTARSIDPVFQQLIVQNRGEIAALDLSLGANISGKIAQRYLVAKADEFGTGSRQHPERGQVYYFISASTLGSIFDDSDTEVPAVTAAPSSVVSLPVFPPQAIATALPLPTTELTPTAAPVIPVVTPDIPAHPEVTNIPQLLDEQPVDLPIASTVEPPVPPDSPPIDRPLVTIIQSELAKRLDVHSSTVYKRRSEPNFTDWTRNRDPEGIGWGYLETSKEYYRVDHPS